MSRKVTETFTVLVNKQTGEPATSKSGQIGLQTASGRTLWVPKQARLGKYITYNVFEKGDFFIAVRDSKRTKLQAWLQANPGKAEGDCTIPVDEQGDILYHTGDKVERTEGSLEFSGFTDNKEPDMDKMFELAAKYQVKLSVY